MYCRNHTFLKSKLLIFWAPLTGAKDSETQLMFLFIVLI